MSRAGAYFHTGMAIVNKLSGEKPHSSITDWVEVLSSDRYDELSLDGIPELVDSVNLQGHQGTTEAARAIRKKLKYGNVHRQLRALVILRALTENAGKGFQLNWANAQLLERLEAMASDNLLDPRVKKRLVLVFHAWSIQYADEPRMHAVANLYRQYGGAAARRRSHAATGSISSRDAIKDAPKASPASPADGAGSRGFSESDPFYDHTWEPAPGQRGKDTYADLALAKSEAEERRRERESRQALERREAELERRERDLQRKAEMRAVEERRQREAEEEAQRRKKAKELRKQQASQPKRPKFNFEKEKPAVMASVANANQAANNLVNACRLINRETENVTESPRVQNSLDKAKAARRTVIRYIQVVTDEEYVGTLLDANERVVEAIKLYDKMSKPAVLDSDSETEQDPRYKDEADQVDRLRQRLEAQKLESQRTGEVQQLQEAQMAESQRQARRAAKSPAASGNPYAADLQDLDFSGSIARNPRASALPPPIRPDSAPGSDELGTLSDFSDYDSSEEEYRAAHSRQASRNVEYEFRAGGRGGPSGSGGAGGEFDRDAYASLDNEGADAGLMDPNDPFGDPFADENETQGQAQAQQPKRRMQWAEI